jgi:rhodanese-related sulfurtransferase
MADAPLPIETDCQSVQRDLGRENGPLILDCREQEEWDVVHIDRAKLVPMSQLASRIGELESYRNARIVVHCHHGGRSLRVAEWLRKVGFEKAQSMAGGIDAWSQTVDPTLPRY